MVLVEPRKHHNIYKQNFFRRHSYRFNINNPPTPLLIYFNFSGSGSVSNRLEEIHPAVDIPVQFNFGSPYSSSMTIFFDFEDSRQFVQDQKGNKKRIQ